mgnify:CR=1 FL=1|jgi:hypothetical protein
MNLKMADGKYMDITRAMKDNEGIFTVSLNLFQDVTTPFLTR